MYCITYVICCLLFSSDIYVSVMYGNVFRADCDKEKTLQLLDGFTTCGTIAGSGLKYVSCGKKAPTARFIALRVTKKSPIHIKEIQAYGPVTVKPKPVAKAKCGKSPTLLLIIRCGRLQPGNRDILC